MPNGVQQLGAVGTLVTILLGRSPVGPTVPTVWEVPQTTREYLRRLVRSEFDMDLRVVDANFTSW
jgi:hypothetical protein